MNDHLSMYGGIATAVLSLTWCGLASSDEILFSKALSQGRTSDSFIVQIPAKDILIFDSPPSGRYVVHGRRLIVIAARARVDAKVVVSSFDGTDIPPPFQTIGPKGADGPNGAGQTGGKGNPGQPGRAPDPLNAAQGATGVAAREMVFDIAQLTGTGTLSIDNAGAKGGKGQKGGKGGTGGQGARGADGSDSLVDCKSSGGDAGPAAPGGPGGDGGTGGTGGDGGIVYLSAALSTTNPLVETSFNGGDSGDVGDPGEHGDGGAPQDGGSGSTYCSGGHGTGRGPNGPDGHAGQPGQKGKPGKIVKIEK